MMTRIDGDSQSVAGPGHCLDLPSPAGRCFRFERAHKRDRFAGIVAMRHAAILKHKEKGRFNLNAQAN